MLLGVDADVYFTGEMSHVGIHVSHPHFSRVSYHDVQHEVLAATAAGRNVILCKLRLPALSIFRWFTICNGRWTHKYRKRLPTRVGFQAPAGIRQGRTGRTKAYGSAGHTHQQGRQTSSGYRVKNVTISVSVNGRVTATMLFRITPRCQFMFGVNIY